MNGPEPEPEARLTLRQARHQFERAFITAALERHKTIAGAARELGLELSNLHRRMKALGMLATRAAGV